MSVGDEHVLAIDLGTGGPKAALVDRAGRITAHEFEPTPLELLGDGGAEQDPDAWWAAITAAVRRVVGAGAVPVDDIVGVSITSQWSGTVAVDAEGRHLYPAVIWMDSRGAPYVHDLVTGPVNIAGYDPRRLKPWIQKTGGIPSHSGKDPVGHILWLRHERPEVYRAAHAFLEPCDYLNARLTGRQCASFDSIVAHWLTDNRDLTRVRYDAQLLGFAGLTESQFPELVPSASVVGEVLPDVAADWGLAPGTKVVTATGDVHSAVVGSGALGDYEGHLYMGTSSWLSCHLPQKRTDLLHNQAALPSAVPGRYFLANEHEVGGGALLWLRDQAGMVRDYAEANELAATSPPGSNRVIFTPWLNGERTPVDDHTIRGGWNNLSLTTNRADLVRSVLEGVAYNSRWLLDTVEKFVKRPLDGLNFVGGGAQSDLWCQIHADVCDRTIRRVADPQHANTRGAAFVAWLALGRADLAELNRAVTIDREFHPDPSTRAVYAPLYREFLKLYKAHKAIHARLNRT
jgi:xylulokinase